MTRSDDFTLMVRKKGVIYCYSQIVMVSSVLIMNKMNKIVTLHYKKTQDKWAIDYEHVAPQNCVVH